MDDLLTGTDTLDEAIKLSQQLEVILLKSGFVLRKWLSNEIRIFQNGKQQVDERSFQINDSKEAKTLGLLWEPRDDNLVYKLKTEQRSKIFTKRVILASVAQIFDPLGLINLCIAAKLILQRLWQNKLDWDQTVPDSIKIDWLNFLKGMQDLNSIKIPRCIVLPLSYKGDITRFLRFIRISLRGMRLLIFGKQSGRSKVAFNMCQIAISAIKISVYHD